MRWAADNAPRYDRATSTHLLYLLDHQCGGPAQLREHLDDMILEHFMEDEPDPPAPPMPSRAVLRLAWSRP